MRENTYGNQGMDLKRLILVLGRKLWLLAAGMLLGALVGGICYKAVTQLTNGQVEYRASADYYITFNFDEFEHGDDYYNAYTWDGILRDDPLVDYALEQLSDDITKDMVKAAVTGEMLGDYRILTVHVTTEKKERTNEIANAYRLSLEHFGDSLELFDRIELWSQEEAKILEKNTKTLNAAFLGGVLGGLLLLFGLLFYYVLEDGCYIEKDAQLRFALPVYGIQTREQDEEHRQILKDNLKEAFGEDEIETWNGEYVPAAPDYERLRKAEHLLLNVPWGRNNGRQIERVLTLLELHQCKVEGILITDADAGFLKAFYFI